MTALITQLASGVFTPANTLLPPLPTVVGGTTALWSYIGTDIGHSQNLMPSSPVSVNGGTPTYQPAYGTFLAAGPPTYIDTGVKDDNRTFSLLFACRNANTLNSPNATVPIGNIDTATNFGININLSGTGLVFAVNGPAGGPSRTLAVANVNTWKLYACAFDSATNTMDTWDLTAQTNDHFVAGAGNRILAASTNFWIGANPRPTGNQPCDVAFAGLIKGQAITLAIANQYAANIRANLALRGLIVP
jgi:hypothetical protein